MRRICALAGLVIWGAAQAFAATPQTVLVKTPSGASVASAWVAALHFSTGGPDTALSRVALTNGSGSAALSLADNVDYEIFVSSQGWLPSIRDQFNSPAHVHVMGTGSALPDQTVVLDNSGVTRLIEIDVPLQNATNNELLFGDLKPNAAGTDSSVAFGVAFPDGTNHPTLVVPNVPRAGGNSYVVGCFDPVRNKGVNGVIPEDYSAAADNSVHAEAALDFDGGIPPSAVAAPAQQQYNSDNSLSVDAAVLDQATGEPIPWIQVNLNFVRNDPYCTNCIDGRWMGSDQNGHLQFFGLQGRTTYYVTLNSGCNWQTGKCYQGVVSTFTAYNQPPYSLSVATAMPMMGNDFFYDSTGTVKTVQFKMKQAAGGNHALMVYIKDQNGVPLPQSGVNLGPDNRSWETSGSCAGNQRVSNPGLANVNMQATTGYALLTGLPAGSYMLNIWTQFSQNQGTSFNAGTQSPPSGSDDPNSQSVSPQGDVWDWSRLCGSGNWRLTIDDTTGLATVYDSSGAAIPGMINRSSITVTVTVPASGTGLVKGTLSFPSSGLDFSDPKNIINITLQPQCDNGSCQGRGGYAVLDQVLSGNATSYQVAVSSGAKYYMNVTSNYYGVVHNGGGSDQVDLTSTGTASVNMQFAPAGRVTGRLFKPDGSLFTPTNGASNVQANINAEGDNSWGWSQVNADGSYLIGGLLPGKYSLHVQGWVNGSGSFNYTDSSPMPSVSVTANQDTYKDIYLINGIPVRIDADTTTLPSLTISDCQGQQDDKYDCPAQNWVVKSMQAGTVMDVDKISEWILKGGSQSNDEFQFAIDSAAVSRVCNGPGQGTPAGFCVNRVPSPSNLDMYLTRKGGFNPNDGAGASVRPYFVIMNSTRNVVVDSNPAGKVPYYWGGSTLTVRAVNLTPAVPSRGAGVTLKGRVAGANIIRQSDFMSFGGSQDNFFKYIPLLTLYDSNNALKAVGAVVPDPTCFNTPVPALGPQATVNDAFNIYLTGQDWQKWSALFFGAGAPCAGNFSWGYEIRGLPANQSFTAVLTTPNYPPYQFKVQLGADGSTAALDPVDLEQAVGLGATINGVVVATFTVSGSSIPVPNAAVTLEADGYKQKTFTTVESGTFTATGLPAGTFRLTAVANGFALQPQTVAVGAHATVSATIALPKAEATVTGTVYAQKVPYAKLQPNALVLARPEEESGVTDDLPVYRTYTSSVGVFQIDGLVANKLYRVYVSAPGKMVVSATTVTINGIIGGLEFNPAPKPLDVQVYGKPVGSTYRFTLLNPADFSSGRAWIGPAPFAKPGLGEVTNSFQQLPNNEMVLDYPTAGLSASQDYILHIEAVSVLDFTKTVTKELVFGIDRSAGAEISIDQAILGDNTKDDRGHSANEALFDYSGDNPSSVQLPAGAMIAASSAAVPTMSLSQKTVAASTQAAALGSDSAFASGVYQVSIASAQYATDRGVDLTLAYDKSSADISDLAAYHFNSATGKWELIPGLQTIDPLRGTITVKKLKSLTSVLGLQAASPLRARWTAQGFVPAQAQAAGLRLDDSGSFAVIKPSQIGASFAGTVIKIFNYPNPFNLLSTAKTFQLKNGVNAGSTIQSNGTVIKLELPATITGGHGTIRIYNLAGEMVRELDLGEGITGGAYYYTQWDGKNKNGASVANGVYYGVLNLPGVKAKDGTFKMAVVK